MSFEWQTEEEFNWNAEPAPPLPPAKPPWRWRRWLIGLSVLVMLLGGVAWYLYRQIDERVQEVTARTQEEIIASHNLIQTAASDRDIDLFISFLSGREPEWAFGAEDAVRQGAFLNRPNLGLTWVPSVNETKELIIQNMSADLTSAEVTFQQDYAIDIGNGLTETITLDHINVYRLGPNRWLLAPPEAEFWGENLVHRGERLHLNYPERDKEIGRRLGVDLDAKLQEACHLLNGLNCPSNLVVQAHLTTNPGTLATNLNADALVFDLDDLRLPAPSLVGLPQDEQGYQVLLRGYATQMVSALLASSAGWECCRHVHYYQPLLEYQLVQLGLQSWPMTAAHYQKLAETLAGLDQAEGLWDVDTGARQLDGVAASYALVEFLATAVSEISLAEKQAELVRRPNDRLVDWIMVDNEERFPDTLSIERNFSQFVYEKAGLAQQPIPQPLPGQSLQALCRLTNSEALTLFHYDLASHRVEQLRVDSASSAFMTSLPDDSGVIIVEQPVAGAVPARTFIWQNGREEAVIHQDFQDLFALLPMHADPTEQQLVLRVINQASAPFATLPLAECVAGNGCVATALLGLPSWSPSGEQSLALRSTEFDPEQGEGLLFVGNNNVQQLDYIGEGAAPFWIDESTIGYVLGGQSVQRRSTDLAAPETIFTVADLLNSMTADEPPNAHSLMIDFVQLYAHDPDLLFVATADPLGRIGESYLFSYRLSTGEMMQQQVLNEQRRESVRRYRLSPSGRWLLISRFDGAGWRLHLYDMVDNRLRLLLDGAELSISADRYVDWSGDERWLTMVDGGVVQLIALDGSGFERPLFLTEGGCTAAVWVNSNS